MNNLYRFFLLSLVPLELFTFYVVHPLVEWWLNTVVATWEETVKSVFREMLSTVIRFLSGVSAFLISLFVDRSYYRSATDMAPLRCYQTHHFKISLAC
jgi:hypothetical protein